ncbi:MAG: OpgC family protein [Candidatus Competibacterales bacterium]
MALSPQRDLRLDFFRGIAMIIILIAHVPGNWWTRYIPARFGFSDATEMFVFCSGFAAALAFGATYQRAGFGLGTVRVGYRVWQVYVAHLGLFFAVATICLLGNAFVAPITGRDYVTMLNLGYFFNHTDEALLGLFTLTYVPNYFDILPMYIGALCLIPVVMMLKSVHVGWVVGFCAAVYFANWWWDGGIPAHPRHDHIEWFFNPLGWQFLFFTGFCFGAGWIAPPPQRRWLAALCLGIVVAAIPVSFWRILNEYEVLREVRSFLRPAFGKTDFGPLRWLHFMALAYLALWLIQGRERLLHRQPARLIVTVGQQSLAIFLFSMGFSRIMGMGLNLLEHYLITAMAASVQGMALALEPDFFAGRLTVVIDGLAQLGVDRSAYLDYYLLGLGIINILGIATLIAVAHGVAWIKSVPWKRPAPSHPVTPRAGEMGAKPGVVGVSGR